MSSHQIAVRLPADVLAELDALVEDGTFDSRAAAVRIALEAAIDAERRRRTGAEIVAGYEQNPQSGDSDLAAWAAGSGLDLINEERW